MLKRLGCNGRGVAAGLLSASLAAVIAVIAADAGAQGMPPDSRNPVCVRLEAQLANLDRGAPADGRAEQVRRLEEAVNRQQQDLDRLQSQARRNGCEGGGFFLFGGAPAQCDQINGQIQRMRGNLERMLGNLRQLQAAGGGRDEQRRSILMALGQNDCGPQYRSAAAQPTRPRGGGGLFETLFGGPSQPAGSATSQDPNAIPADPSQSGAFRTVCVRTCDGFFFPISYSTSQARFRDDERICQRMCPASEVALYAHRNPGEDIAQAVSINGQPYTQHPNAFRYRREFTSSCACKAANQSWNEVVQDDAPQSGDIVVTEDRARAMAQPKPDPQKQQATPKQQQKQQARTKRDNRNAQQQKKTQANAQEPTGSTIAPPAAPANSSGAPRAVGTPFYR